MSFCLSCKLHCFTMRFLLMICFEFLFYPLVSICKMVLRWQWSLAGWYCRLDAKIKTEGGACSLECYECASQRSTSSRCRTCSGCSRGMFWITYINHFQQAYLSTIAGEIGPKVEVLYYCVNIMLNVENTHISNCLQLSGSTHHFNIRCRSFVS